MLNDRRGREKKSDQGGRLLYYSNADYFHLKSHHLAQCKVGEAICYPPPLPEKKKRKEEKKKRSIQIQLTKESQPLRQEKRAAGSEK